MPGTRAKVIQVRIATSVAHDGGTVMAAPAGDNWKVECDSTFWEREQTFKLKHVETKQVGPPYAALQATPELEITHSRTIYPHHAAALVPSLHRLAQVQPSHRWAARGVRCQPRQPALRVEACRGLLRQARAVVL